MKEEIKTEYNEKIGSIGWAYNTMKEEGVTLIHEHGKACEEEYYLDEIGNIVRKTWNGEIETVTNLWTTGGYINGWRRKWKEEIIQHNGRKLKVIEVLEQEKTKEEIEFDKWCDDKYCLEAVKEDGNALQYVHNQTEEICLEAIKENRYALQHVHNQTEKICLEAVKQNGRTLQFVHNQTEKICLEAVKQNGYALQYVYNQTEEICLEAVKQDSCALQYAHDKDKIFKILKNKK